MSLSGMISLGARLWRTLARNQGLFFQRKPRSRRSSNEVAPSARGGGGARDLRSRFVANRGFRPAPAEVAISSRRAAYCGLPPGVASADMVRSRLISGWRSFVEPVAMLRIPVLCGAAGHSQTGVSSAKFGYRRGIAKGVTIPLAAFFAYFLSHHRK